MTTYLNGAVRLQIGDCRDTIRGLADASIDSVVTDPPYALQFMGKRWDTGAVAFDPAFWTDVLRVLKPGGHVLAMGGTRTFHRLACAIEDAGFEIRDTVAWIYGSGFPKSLDVSKAIDKAAGAERERTGSNRPENRVAYGKGTGALRCNICGNSRNGTSCGCPVDSGPATDAARQWQGWGTALKPSIELVTLARKPLIGTVAANVQQFGTGALNIDGCRVGGGEPRPSMTGGMARKASPVYGAFANTDVKSIETTLGRWPANIIHDGSDEVMGAFAAFGESKSRIGKPRGAAAGDGWGMTKTSAEYDDTGTAARFFYTAKADKHDRADSKHPTVKPVDLMRYLVRLVTPKGGTVLDPFAGTGTTGEAAYAEGMRAILCELDPTYVGDIERRVSHARLLGPLFGMLDEAAE